MKIGPLLPFLAFALGCATASIKAPSAPVSGTVAGSTFTAKGVIATRPAIDTCQHEFATGPVPFTEREILNAIRAPAKAKVELPTATDAAGTGPSAWEKLRTK